MKPGKHQRSKQRCQDLSWKVHDRAQSFVLPSYTMYELRNQHVSTVAPHYNEMPSYRKNMFVIAGSSLLLAKTPLFKKWKTCTVFLLRYRNTSRSLVDWEMLWEHEPHHSFLEFSQTFMSVLGLSKSIRYSGDFVIVGFITAGFVSTYFTVILRCFQMMFIITGSLL